MGDVVESPEDEDSALSSSYEENKNFQTHANGYRDVKNKESYNFYQVCAVEFVFHFLLYCLFTSLFT
jgi:hypothetical protein